MRTVTANVFSFWSKTEQTEKVGHDHQPPGATAGSPPGPCRTTDQSWGNPDAGLAGPSPRWSRLSSPHAHFR